MSGRPVSTPTLTLSSTAAPRVVIIGGGIAGMSAAMALADCQRFGHLATPLEIVLLESRKSTGGRAGSFSDAVSGETVDYCQHVAMGCCTNLLDLLRQCGLQDCFTRYETLTFYHPHTGLSSFRPHRWLPAPLHLNAALSGLRYLSQSQKHRIRCGLWALMRTSDNSLANTVAADWLARNKQDRELRMRFWDVILVSALGDVPERVSMQAARKVLIDGFTGARGASDVWVPNQPLSEIFGTAMFKQLAQRAVIVRTQSPVRSIQCPDHDSSRARVLLSSGERIEAGHVILATHWRSASRLIASLAAPHQSTAILDWQRNLSTVLSSIESSPITGLHLWFDRVLTPHPHVAMVGTISQWLFREPLQQPNPNHSSPPSHYHQVVISGQHPLSDAPKETLIEHVMQELRDAFPAAQDAQLLQSRVVTDPTAVYRVSNEFQSHRPNPKTALPWLHLAGDYIQTGWPATMEGAVISGRLAAQLVTEQLSPNSVPPLVHSGLLRGLLARMLIR